MDTQEQELSRRMESLKERKANTAGAVLDAKREVEDFRDQYEILLAEDKSLDKTFRKEFSDQDTHTVDQLYKLFKRRPRLEFYKLITTVKTVFRLSTIIYNE